MSHHEERELILPPTGGTYTWDDRHRLPSPGMGLISLDLATRPDLSICLAPEDTDTASSPCYHAVLSDGVVSITRSRGGESAPAERVAHGPLPIPGGTTFARPRSSLSRAEDAASSGGPDAPGVPSALALWVLYANGRIAVGTGQPGTGPACLDWTDPQPVRGIARYALAAFDSEMQVSALACYAAPPESLAASAAAAGGDGGPGPGVEEFNAAPAYGQHRFEREWVLPRRGCGVVAFEANTAGTVVVGFSAEPRVEAEMYEIVASRRECAIRREAQAREDAASLTGDALSAGGEDGWGAYWISVDQGVVTFGHGAAPGEAAHSAKSALLRYADPDPLQVLHFSLTSWSHAVAYRAVRAIDVGADHGPGSDAQVAAVAAGAMAGAEARAAADRSSAGRGTGVSLGAGGMFEADSLSSREYLEATVLPTLTRGIEELLRLVDKRERDIAQGYEVTETFHPLNWLASYVMRNHPGHAGGATAADRLQAATR